MPERVFSQTFGVVGAILEKDGKFLLVKEAGTVDKGKWNQPAGWPDVGEDLIQAAVREVKEETGIAFRPEFLLGVYSLVRQDLTPKLGATPHALKFIFIGKIIEETPSNITDEITELKWFTPEEIFLMDTSQLRDLDIKKEIRDFMDNKKYPLDVVTQTIS